MSEGKNRSYLARKAASVAIVAGLGLSCAIIPMVTPTQAMAEEVTSDTQEHDFRVLAAYSINGDSVTGYFDTLTEALAAEGLAAVTLSGNVETSHSENVVSNVQEYGVVLSLSNVMLTNQGLEDKPTFTNYGQLYINSDGNKYDEPDSLNGGIESVREDVPAIYNTENGYLELIECTYKGLIKNEGNITIRWGDYSDATFDTSNRLTIHDGNFSDTAFENSGYVTIYGGNFKNASFTGEGSISILGGHFTSDPSEYVYGHAIRHNDDGTFDVITDSDGLSEGIYSLPHEESGGLYAGFVEDGLDLFKIGEGLYEVKKSDFEGETVTIREGSTGAILKLTHSIQDALNEAGPHSMINLETDLNIDKPVSISNCLVPIQGNHHTINYVGTEHIDSVLSINYAPNEDDGDFTVASLGINANGKANVCYEVNAAGSYASISYCNFRGSTYGAVLTHSSPLGLFCNTLAPAASAIANVIVADFDPYIVAAWGDKIDIPSTTGSPYHDNELDTSKPTVVIPSEELDKLQLRLGVSSHLAVVEELNALNSVEPSLFYDAVMDIATSNKPETPEPEPEPEPTPDPDPTPVPTPDLDEDVTVPEADGGTVEVEPVPAGETATVVAEPEAGQEVRDVVVTDSKGNPVETTVDGDGNVTFEMPEGGVKVEVVFGCDGGELCGTHAYPDIDQGDWYHDPVDWAIEEGVVHGYDDGTFGPNDVLTREQAAAVLYNYLGGTEGSSDSGLADVADDWYTDAVNWAVANGVMTGYEGTGTFGVGEALTREQFCAVVAKAMKVDLSDVDTSVLDAFPDAALTSDWAKPAVAWAVQMGIVNGVELDDGTRILSADRDITRAEMAAMMLNAVDAGALVK